MSHLALGCPSCDAHLGGFLAKWRWFWRGSRPCPACGVAFHFPVPLQVIGYLWSGIAALPILGAWLIFGVGGLATAIVVSGAVDALLVVIARPSRT